MNKPIIIGIAGGSASGKTSIANKLRDTFSDEKSVLIIRQDDYYKRSITYAYGRTLQDKL